MGKVIPIKHPTTFKPLIVSPSGAHILVHEGDKTYTFLRGDAVTDLEIVRAVKYFLNKEGCKHHPF